MEKRFQVFVSSTFTDLVDERRAVIQALLELNCIPAGMELFPASSDEQWTVIQRVIDDCDYYLVIVAGRYGSIDAGGINYTEKEYDYAVASGKARDWSRISLARSRADVSLCLLMPVRAGARSLFPEPSDRSLTLRYAECSAAIS